MDLARNTIDSWKANLVFVSWVLTRLQERGLVQNAPVCTPKGVSHYKAEIEERQVHMGAGTFRWNLEVLYTSLGRPVSDEEINGVTVLARREGLIADSEGDL